MATELVYIKNLTEVNKGLKELHALLVPGNALLERPWKAAMEALAEAGAEAARQAAPVGKTGQLKAGIYARVQKGTFPKWVAIRSRAKRKSPKYPRGYPYPRLLEYSAKHGHKGWFSTAIEGAWGQKAESVLAEASNEIAKIWQGFR